MAENKPSIVTADIPADVRLWANASRNALNRLVRCIFAERLVEPTALLWAQDQRQAWLPLWPTRRVLHFSNLHMAPAGTLQNRGYIGVIDGSGARREVEDPAIFIREISSALSISPALDGLENLTRDIENSMQNDALARGHRETWSAEVRQKVSHAGASGFLSYVRENYTPYQAAMLLEQWGSLEGHPFYPTWKSKPGLPPDEVKALAPEFGGRVGVRITALRKQWAYIEAMPHIRSYSEWFSENFADLWREWARRLEANGKSVEDWIPLPVHGWHLDNFVLKEFAAEIASGILDPDGPEIVTRPSMSFRTMMPDVLESRPFMKLPVAIWMTSEQRTLQAKSICMGPRLSAMVSTILAREPELHDQLEIFGEELGAILHHPETGDEHPGRFLSVVFRNTDPLARSDGHLPIPVATLLTASPMDGRPLIRELIAARNIETQTALEDFFRAYAHTIVRPTLALYLLYGIALEPHQQNCMILFDHTGLPRKMLIRDFGDGRSFAPLFEERGYHLAPFVRDGILPTTFYDDIHLVRSLVISSAFICNLHEIALHLTEQFELHDSRLWRIIAEEVENTFDTLKPRISSEQFWQQERDAFLRDPWPTRSLLRMHIERYKDYRVHHELPNPLADFQ